MAGTRHYNLRPRGRQSNVDPAQASIQGQSSEIIELPIQSQDLALQARTFHLFPKLCLELRLMIWEHTWPTESRVMEARDCMIDHRSPNNQVDDEGDQDDIEMTFNLKLTGRLAPMLQTHFVGRSTDDEVFEKCQSPVALHVCRESRAHTMKEYRKMHHPEIPQDGFFFSPRRDVLLIPIDASWEPEKMADLYEAYGSQLDLIQTMVVGFGGTFDLLESVEFNIAFVEPLVGLKRIMVVDGGRWERASATFVDPVHGAVTLLGPESFNQPPILQSYITAEELRVAAQNLKEDYIAASRTHGFEQKQLQVLDRNLIEY